MLPRTMSILPALTPARLEQNAKLHHLLHALGSVRYSDYRHRFELDGARGTYGYDNAQGDLLVIAWDGAHAVALAHDHESERTNEEGAPDGFPWMRDVAARGPALFEKTLAFARGWQDRFTPSTAVWSDAAGGQLSGDDEEAASRHGLWMLERYALEPKDALFGRKGQSWHTLASTPRPLSKLALELLTRSPPVLARREVQALVGFSAPKGSWREQVRAALGLLQGLGVTAEVAPDLRGLEPAEAVIDLPGFKKAHRRGSRVEHPVLTRLQLTLSVLEPTRFSRGEWPRVIALELVTPAVSGWDKGEYARPEPRVSV